MARAVFFGLVLWTGDPAAQVRLQEEFDAPELNFERWCPCQMNLSDAPPRFPDDPDEAGDRILQIVADDASLGGNLCRSGPPEFECDPATTAFDETGSDLDMNLAARSDPMETLGPSFISSAVPLANGPAFLTTKNPYCPGEVLERAKSAGEEDECIQRQELRPQRQFLHEAQTAHNYHLRFRMPALIEDRTRSIRWVTAQWKQEPVSSSYQAEFGSGWAPSPFLAQRFDDGVLHVTVQEEHCRCMVASAPRPDGSTPEWKDGTPQFCLSTDPGDPAGRICTSSLHLSYGPDPILKAPLGEWIEMEYRVQANGSAPALMEIRQDQRLIVKVEGRIGYDRPINETSLTKFKFGHYRDYMPYRHVMEIDYVNIYRDKSE